MLIHLVIPPPPKFFFQRFKKKEVIQIKIIEKFIQASLVLVHI